MKTFKEAQTEKALSGVDERNLIECYDRITDRGNLVNDEWMQNALLAIIHCAPMVVRRRAEFGASVKVEGWFPNEEDGFMCIGMVEGTNKCAATACHESLWDVLLPSVIEEGDLSETVWELSTEAGSKERVKVNSQIGDLVSVSFWDTRNDRWSHGARHMFKSNLIKHYREVKDYLATAKGTPT